MGMHGGKKGAQIIVFLQFFLCKGKDITGFGILVLRLNTRQRTAV